MSNDEPDEVIKELFHSLENRYRNNLESMKGNEFVFDCVQILYYKCHKINPNCGRSYICSSDWIKSKKNQEYILSIKKIMNAFNIL